MTNDAHSSPTKSYSGCFLSTLASCLKSDWGKDLSFPGNHVKILDGGVHWFVAYSQHVLIITCWSNQPWSKRNSVFSGLSQVLCKIAFPRNTASAPLNCLIRFPATGRGPLNTVTVNQPWHFLTPVLVRQWSYFIKSIKTVRTHKLGSSVDRDMEFY